MSLGAAGPFRERKMSHRMSDRMSEQKSDRRPENLSDWMRGRMSKYVKVCQSNMSGWGSDEVSFFCGAWVVWKPKLLNPCAHIHILSFYMHTYIHACMHTFIHTYIHSCLHTFINTYIHIYILLIFTYVYIYIYIY